MNLDVLVESHLGLQVKISYFEHHNFLIRHGLGECSYVLDVGCGNGAFVARLAQDHPGIKFVGIDKRKQYLESCQKLISENLSFTQVDMFARDDKFDFSIFDGFLMRYFLLHVDNPQKIFELLKTKLKSKSKLWIIDLDCSQFRCDPPHPTFDKLTKLVKDFCSKISPHSMGGQNVLPMLQKLRYQNIIVEKKPLSTEKIGLKDLMLYIRQEVLCYSFMMGKKMNDPETLEVLEFLDENGSVGNFNISYGMVLFSAELSP